MDPIPEWVRRLWDVWDVRVLVLLSLTLQIILSILGNRRKNISSLWISVLVWSAYLTADWVATVSLGKLSNAQVDYDTDINALWAIWAPLLLLHLGGPDTIAAYSVEDNQLWMRHLLGLMVQLFVAVYIILLSWKHSWFSYMSLPALVAGVIKYGERIWVLKSVSDDKSGNIVPFGDLRYDNTIENYEETQALYFAHMLLKVFKREMEYYDLSQGLHSIFEFSNVRDNVLWDVMEVEMGLMYDILYTKATINYSKRGWILRCISFACTVTVLVGLIFRLIFMKEDREKWDELDIAITGVLIVGALALEIYAIVVLHLSSDWAMLWLIKHNRVEKVIRLRQNFPWLFRKNKSWSKRMGQFDLLNYYIEDSQHDRNGPSIKRTLGLVLGVFGLKDRLYRYKHKSDVVVDPLFYNLIADFFVLNRWRPLVSGIMEEKDIWKVTRNLAKLELHTKIFYMYIATEACYHLEMEWDTDHTAQNNGTTESADPASLLGQNREICKTLSHYMMYIFLMSPSLLAGALTATLESEVQYFKKDTIKDKPDIRTALCAFEDETDTVIGRLISHLKNKDKEKRWEALKFVWLRLLCLAAMKCQKNEHLKQLRQGGELLTLVWFFLPQYNSVRGHDYWADDEEISVRDYVTSLRRIGDVSIAV